ncbi:hypothetical protein TGAM01_v203296 [Trichoderma gamsii]|uniref:Uncharacterized protein n=1 Tax=Trichoderma gamsii TaxID=398673 RepID=A0A2P4ZTB8_9HYPO|nr:hypothetical protein TGAM01_v203296 [Trichoderma gamsii]PON27529.1 hypothetical protein TGAM01_v203296 [Trichoderma gamsii]
MLVQRQHMQGEEVVAGMNVPRDQPHLTSARCKFPPKPRFEQRLEVIQGPPSPQASVSAMMLSLQRRVESQQ